MAPRRANGVHELGAAKLASSGLTERDGDALGLEYLTAEQTAALCATFKSLASVKIPYYTPTEPAQPMVSWPQAPAFYRVRYLETPNDFNRITDKKQQRYVQPAGSGVCAYFPRLLRGWQQALSRPDVPLFITEGEFKAAKGCKEGFPTIGLGGVYNWRSTQHGHYFLPELDGINWVQRRVYIVFDSDARSNPQVCHALNSLGEQLQNRGAFPYYLPLPDGEGGLKTGLDDFLTAERNPRTALENLVNGSAQLITLAKPLWRLNDKVIYIFNPGIVIDLDTKMKMDPTKFISGAYAAEEAIKRTVGKDGTIKMEPVSAAAAWVKWPLRHQATQMTYKPGQPTYVTDEDGHTNYNVWPGWGCTPAPGDATPFVDLVKHLFTTSDDEGAQAAEWFFDWLAYPIQHPGVKLFTSVLVHGRRQGTGKSLVGYTMARIYGKNFTEINQANLHNNFNEWAESRQFVMGDDVTGSNKRDDADILKKMVTQRELRVNAKYIPSYTVPDCINFYFTSNHPDAFFLEDDDRRFFIHEVLQPPLPEDFYVEYMMWLDSGGATHVFDWLKRRDISAFNPAAHAFSTAAKRRMISDVKSDLGAWIEQLRQHPDQTLRIESGGMTMPGDLFTAKQLLQLYDPYLRTGTTANGLAREMKRSGFVQVCEGKSVRGPDGNLDKYFAVRNAANWLDRNQDFAAQYLQRLHTGDDPGTPPATIIVLNTRRERKPRVKKY